jgi:hypothetical protein
MPHHHNHHGHHKRNHHKFNFGNFIKDNITKPIGKLEHDGVGIINHGIHEAGQTSRSLIKTGGGILDKISMPLIIVGGLVAFMVLSKK